MSVPESLKSLVGNWKGTYKLVTPWTTPSESDSESTAEAKLVAGGNFLNLDYTWEDKGKPQEGTLLLGRHPKTGTVSVAWVDSWHQSGEIMHCQGAVDNDGAVSVLGSYPAPPDPDWHWRTVLEPRGDDAFDLVMFNISPAGEETLAVRARYTRGK